MTQAEQQKMNRWSHNFKDSMNNWGHKLSHAEHNAGDNFKAGMADWQTKFQEKMSHLMDGTYQDYKMP